MSKKSKAASREKNLQKKRAQRAANRAHFQELARLGQNTKSVRFRRKSSRKKKANTVSHPFGPCGNIGCRKCNTYGQFGNY